MRGRHEPAELRLPGDPGRPASDWQRFGRHGFRVACATLLDFPLPIDATSRPWAATIWPDPRQPGGWGRQLWRPDPRCGRGWVLDERLVAADVIEFGVETPGSAGPAGVLRWYGVVHSYDLAWLDIEGPYPLPAAALGEAELMLAAVHHLAVQRGVSATRCTRRRQESRATRP